MRISKSTLTAASMKTIFADGNAATVRKLKSLRDQAIADRESRVSLRIQGIMLSIEKHTSGEIASLLKADRTAVYSWIKNWNLYRENGLLEGHRSGRPAGLSEEQKNFLADIVESGPVAYGFNSGIWTSVMVRDVIDEEFGIAYHPGHVRKMLKGIGFSVQHPTISLAGADESKRNKWVRYTYPNLKKTPARKTR